MQKATATYRAPVGGNKVCEMGGVTFFDGKSTELNSYDHAHLIAKLPGNPNFDITVGEDDKKPPTVEKNRGRPSNADIAAAKEAAEKADAEAKAAAEKAKVAKADHDAVTKQAGKDAPAPVKSSPVATPPPATMPPAPSPINQSAPNPSYNPPIT